MARESQPPSSSKSLLLLRIKDPHLAKCLHAKWQANRLNGLGPQIRQTTHHATEKWVGLGNIACAAKVAISSHSVATQVQFLLGKLGLLRRLVVNPKFGN